MSMERFAGQEGLLKGSQKGFQVIDFTTNHVSQYFSGSLCVFWVSSRRRFVGKHDHDSSLAQNTDMSRCNLTAHECYFGEEAVEKYNRHRLKKYFLAG